MATTGDTGTPSSSCKDGARQIPVPSGGSGQFSSFSCPVACDAVSLDFEGRRPETLSTARRPVKIADVAGEEVRVLGLEEAVAVPRVPRREEIRLLLVGRCRDRAATTSLSFCVTDAGVTAAASSWVLAASSAIATATGPGAPWEAPAAAAAMAAATFMAVGAAAGAKEASGGGETTMLIPLRLPTMGVVQPGVEGSEGFATEGAAELDGAELRAGLWELPLFLGRGGDQGLCRA